MWKFIFLVFLSSRVHALMVKEDGEFLLGTECHTNDDCKKFGVAVCNANSTCECSDFAFLLPEDSTCLAKVFFIGGECDISRQCSYISNEKAECVNNTCVNAEALKEPPFIPARPTNCSDNSQCSENEFCMSGICVSPTVPPVPKITEAVLGSFCVNDTQCPSEGTVCILSLCQCTKGFVPSRSLKACLPKAKAVGDPCTEPAQCVSLNGGVCENEKCAEVTSKLLNKQTAQVPELLIGSTCQNEDECKHIANSTCLENVCQCTKHYITSVTSNSCLPKAKKEGDPCEIDKQCEGVKSSICSKGKCVRGVVAGTKIDGSSGHMPRLSLPLAAFIFIKMSFV